LPDGARIGPVTLAGTEMHVETVDDFSPAAAALRATAEAGSAAFGSGPFRRRALLMLVAEAVGGENG
jgi:hypothetical protein